MGCVLGIDASLTNTALVVLEDGVVTHKKVLNTKLKGVERLDYLCSSFGNYIRKMDIEYCALEGYSMGSR